MLQALMNVCQPGPGLPSLGDANWKYHRRDYDPRLAHPLLEVPGILNFTPNECSFWASAICARQIEMRMLEKPQFGMIAIGYVGDAADNNCNIPQSQILGPVADFRRIVNQTRADRVIVAMPERRGLLPQSDLLDLKFSGIVIEDAPSAYETTFERVCVRELRPSELIFSPALGPQASVVFVKNVYSTILAAVSLVFAAPLMLTVAILVKLTSPGPVLHRQERVGLRGKPFVDL